MAEYRFVTCWRIAAPLPHVFDTVMDSLHWPEWWQGARAVTELEAGDADGIGSVRRYYWEGRLPYRLYFDARTTRVWPLQELAASVDGDLDGRGRWLFSYSDGITAVRHEWHVRTTRRWMNLTAPLARGLFSANHHALMRQGANGLARRLDAQLLHVSSEDVLATGRNPGCGVVAAGIVAGIAATLVQLALWQFASPYSASHMLLRDTRMAAAIVLGRTILPPPSNVDWRAFAVAMIVHFILSIGYALLFRLPASRLRRGPPLTAGAAFGLLLFAVNMYGFTALFPWFAASRDWITAAAHVAFGITLAAHYRYCNVRLPHDSGSG